MPTTPMVQYDRERGPVCFEFEVFYRGAEPRRELQETLCASGLQWLWMSDAGGETSSARRREWTLLTSATATSFLGDVVERDEADDVGRFVCLIGVDPHVETGDWDDELIRQQVTSFCKREEGPISIIILTPGDTPKDYVFVAHSPSVAVQCLLESLGVSRRMATRIVPYSRLHLMALEAVFQIANTP